MSENTLPDAVEQIADWLEQSRNAVAFTGAGISTESGIPDFRSPGGVWSQSTPVMFDDFLAREESRQEYWRQKSLSHDDMFHSEPNPGHRRLADWESQRKLRGVITQNIDNLHQRAGNQRVLELHGTAMWIACLDCGQRYEADPLVRRYREQQQIPACEACDGILKHATVSFGQALPEDVFTEALAWSEEADLFLAIGSSLVVEPAASLPRIAAQHGARLVIINRDSTPLDSLANLVVQAPIGQTLDAIHRHCRASSSEISSEP